MPQRIAIIDTSLFCCWIQVPGVNTAGSEPDIWDYERTRRLIEERIEQGYQLVFPFTALIETGNHIAHSNALRFEKATEFVGVINAAANGQEPWLTFSAQVSTLQDQTLGQVVNSWPEAAARGVSLGDHMITAVADYYSMAGCEVEILSSDAILRTYVPARPTKRPRRRSKR